MLAPPADILEIPAAQAGAGTATVQVPSYDRRCAVDGSPGRPGQTTVTWKADD